MKKFLLISSILLGGVVASKGIPTLGGPTLSGGAGSVNSNEVYNIALQAAYTVGGATGGVTIATANMLAATNTAWQLTNQAGQLNIRSLDITNGGYVTQFATNWDGGTSNFTIASYPQIPGVTPGGGWRIAVGASPGDKSFMDMWLNTRHDSNTPNLIGSELQHTVGGNWAIAPGYGAGVIKHLQKGIGPQNPRAGGSTWNPWSYGQRLAPFEYEPGYTWADTYRIDQLNGTQKFPGIIGRQWTNDAGFGERWELSILKDLNVTFVSGGGGTYVEDRWAISNVVDGAGYYVYPNYSMEGFYHRGAFIQSSKSSTVNGTSLPLSFGDAAQQRLTIASSSLSLYTTNVLHYSTNYQRVVFHIPGSGLNVTSITYPSWLIPTNVSAPAGIPQGYFMRLEVESFGIGDTNKVLVAAGVGPDSTFSFDADAQAFFARASGLPDAIRSNAVNNLVLNLKATNLWTKLDAIYPFAGTDATDNAQNLKSSSFTGSFTGTPAQTDGFVADGTDDYMATGFIPSSAGGNYTLNSGHIAVYLENATVDDLDRPMGVYDSSGGVKHTQLRRNSTTIQISGPNGTTYLSGAGFGGDYTGFWAGSRTNSTHATVQLRASQATGAQASSALPTKQFYIGANNNDGTAATFTAAAFRCATIGGGLTEAELNALKWCIEQYIAQMP